MGDKLSWKLVSSLLIKYEAQHTHGCPERQQAYWRIRSEYRHPDYGKDKPCICGLDQLIGGKKGSVVS